MFEMKSIAHVMILKTKKKPSRQRNGVARFCPNSWWCTLGPATVTGLGDTGERPAAILLTNSCGPQPPVENSAANAVQFSTHRCLPQLLFRRARGPRLSFVVNDPFVGADDLEMPPTAPQLPAQRLGARRWCGGWGGRCTHKNAACGRLPTLEGAGGFGAYTCCAARFTHNPRGSRQDDFPGRYHTSRPATFCGQGRAQSVQGWPNDLHNRRRYRQHARIMPRRAKPPRLYLDPKRRTWSIRDGSRTIRTSCLEGEIREAEAELRKYLGAKHRPQASGSPLIADVLLLYHDDRLMQTKSRDSNLAVWKDAAKWWGDKSVSDITPNNCRTYIASKANSVQMARRGLETLRAALNYWHRSSYGPLDRVPPIPLPPKSQPRRRWLNEEEFGRLLGAARFEHLRRFLLLGWLTGSRPGVILALEWDWIDLDAGIMHRRAPGTAEDAKKRTPPIRIGQELLAHLRAWHEDDGPARRYVVHWNGKKLADIKDAWRSAVAKAGLDAQVIRHTLRHSRATRLMRMGKDPWAISGHLGMSLETLERVYGHHHPDFQKDVADA